MTDEQNPQPDKKFISGPVYDKLKFLALVIMPALATLYFTLGKLWGFPKIEEVMGSITALDTFLGVILGISTNSYNKSEAKYDGKIVITQPDNAPKNFMLEVGVHPDDLETKKEILFKVQSELPPPVLPHTHS